MAWIKRNVSLVISGLIALGLLGFGGYYLWSAIKNNDDIDQKIGQTKEEIRRLLDKPITPSEANLKIAKDEAQRLGVFITDARKHFPSTPPPEQRLDALSFKSLLENTVNDLHKQAGIIKVPTNKDLGPYYFTFEAQRLPVTFPPESLLPLYERLHEVRVIAEILFKSRINELEEMRRAMVPGEGGSGAPPPGGGGPGNYVSGGARTNADTGMVMWPYEVTFQSFSPELAAVLDAFQRSHYGFLIKSVQTSPAEMRREREVRPQEPVVRDPGNPNVRRPPPTNAPAPLTTVISEKPLRVTLRLEVIKPPGK